MFLSYLTGNLRAAEMGDGGLTAMSYDRQKLLLEELQLILLWDRWWGDLGDYDGRRARQMRVGEIVVELCRLILPVRPYFAMPIRLHCTPFSSSISVRNRSTETKLFQSAHFLTSQRSDTGSTFRETEIQDEVRTESALLRTS